MGLPFRVTGPPVAVAQAHQVHGVDPVRSIRRCVDDFAQHVQTALRSKGPAVEKVLGNRIPRTSASQPYVWQTHPQTKGHRPDSLIANLVLAIEVGDANHGGVDPGERYGRVDGVSVAVELQALHHSVRKPKRYQARLAAVPHCGRETVDLCSVAANSRDGCRAGVGEKPRKESREQESVKAARQQALETEAGCSAF